MVIDAHNHPDWHGHNLDRFIENMNMYGIDKSWLLSWDVPDSEWDPYTTNVFSSLASSPVPFERCLYYKERYPDRFVLGYSPDPRVPGALDRLRSAHAIYGVQVYGELKLRMMYDNLDAIRMFRLCGELSIPVLVHIDYEFEETYRYPRSNWWYGGGIEPFERAVKLCPETKFIGHAPGFWAHISGDDQFDKVHYPIGKVVPGGKLQEMFNAYPNLFCDISAGSGLNALNRDPEYAKEFLTEYSDRVLYARDRFDNAHQEFLRSLSLPKDIEDKLFYKNAEKIIGG